jgi:5,10-methylenetetrahydrofolate reductase
MNISQPNENSKTTFDFSNVCREHIAECKIVPGFLKMKSLAPMGIFFGLAY